MIRRLLPILLLPALVAPTAAADVRGDLGIEARLGYDSNPLELPVAGPGGAFTDLELDGNVEVGWNRRASFFLAGSGAARLYDDRADLADTGWADLRTGFTFTPFRRGRRQLSMSLGGIVGAYRSTFIDPATGDVFLSGGQPLGDRFDHDSYGAFLALRGRTGRRVLLLLDAESVRRRFLADYADLPSVASLDDTTTQLRPGVRVLLSRQVLLELTVPLTWRTYDELPALDEAGAPVSGVVREYRTGGLGLALRVAPSDRWNLSIGLQGNDRSDRYAGFYDSLGLAAFTSLSYQPREAHVIRLLASYSNLDYDAARVDDAVDTYLRGGRVARVQAAYEHRLGRHFTWLVEAGALRSDNRDPLFTYDQDWGRTGFRFQL